MEATLQDLASQRSGRSGRNKKTAFIKVILHAPRRSMKWTLSSIAPIRLEPINSIIDTCVFSTCRGLRSSSRSTYFGLFVATSNSKQRGWPRRVSGAVFVLTQTELPLDFLARRFGAVHPAQPMCTNTAQSTSCNCSSFSIGSLSLTCHPHTLFFCLSPLSRVLL